MIDSECKTLALLFRVAVCLVPSGDGRIAVCIRMGDCSRVYRLCNQPLGPTQPPILSGMEMTTGQWQCSEARKVSQL